MAYDALSSIAAETILEDIETIDARFGSRVVVLSFDTIRRTARVGRESDTILRITDTDSVDGFVGRNTVSALGWT